MIAHKNLTALVLLLALCGWACSPKTWQRFATGSELAYLAPLETQKDNPCLHTIHYAPSAEFARHTPMRYIKVRFLIMQHTPGDPNTLQPEETPAYAKRLLEIVNYKLGLNEPMTLPVGNNTPVLPINYRFVLYIDTAKAGDAGVDYAADSTMAYFNVKSSTSGHYDRRAYTQYAPYKGEVLTIVVQEHHPDSIKSATYSAKSTGTGFSDWLKIVGAKQFLEKTVNPDGSIAYGGHRANIFLHETGHSFGLPHTWNTNDGCDDTPMHANCWDSSSPNCPDGIYSNNMMDYNNRQAALTPCQLGIIHYNFAKLGSAQRKYLVPMWCDYKADSTVNIYSSVEWNGAYDLEGDIVVQNSGSLTIRCRVSLPKGAKIIIKPKGTLILDGAHLTNLCGQQWDGIEIWGNEKNKGSLIVYKQPTIDNVAHPVSLPVSP